MFDLFSKSKMKVSDPVFNVTLLYERIAEALADAGLDPDSKSFAALHKMLTDDVAWYFDNVRDDETPLR